MLDSLNTTTSEKPMFHKVFGHLVPLYSCEAVHRREDIQEIVAARKVEDKLFKKIADTCTFTPTPNSGALKCTNPGKFKKLAWIFLSSRRCLIAAMLKDNKKRLLKDRLSLHEIIEKSKEYQILKCLDEPVEVHHEPKNFGGFRTIQKFGPVARAAQRMVSKLLALTFRPQDFQFHNQGSHEKVKHVLRLLKERGYRYVIEIDIKDFYPSFEEGELIANLPLPNEAIRQIILAQYAPRIHPGGLHYHLSDKACPGIPQGSVSSSKLATWCVAHLRANIKVKDVVLVNHVDNFFLVAKAWQPLESASKVLGFKIKKLPGGSFLGVTKQESDVDTGFRMLGCQICRDGNQIIATPTETNRQKLLGKFRYEQQKVHAELKAAMAEQDDIALYAAMQRFVCLRNYVMGWCNAFAFCNDIELIRDDLKYFLRQIKIEYCLMDEVLKFASDRSTKVAIDIAVS